MKKNWALILWVWLIIGCTSIDETAVPNPVQRDIQVILVNSEIDIGLNRFAIALLDQDQQFIDEAEVTLSYFDIRDPDNPVPESSTTAVKRQAADGFTTIYTHPRNFDRAGAWGVQVDALFPDGSVAQQGIAFDVVPAAASLSVGQQVPPVDTLTTQSVAGELGLISTASEPEPAFYRLSLVEALENGRPTLIYFSTPAFCQTRLCAPGYEEFSQFFEASGDDYNFIHVEVFTGLPNPAESGWPLAPAMVAFGLQTEPWLYVVDPAGEIVYRVEGLFTAEELAAAVPQALKGELDS